MKAYLLGSILPFSLLLGCVQEGTNEIDLSGVIDQIEFNDITEQQEYNIEFSFETNRQLDAATASVASKTSSDTTYEFGDSYQYYNFPGQNTIIEISIDAQDLSFPTEITVHIFEMTLPESVLNDWISYQHSSPPLPEPTPPLQSVPLNAEQYFVQSSFFIEHLTGELGHEYERYQVELSINDHYLPGAFNLINFTSTLDVYLRTADVTN